MQRFFWAEGAERSKRIKQPLQDLKQGNAVM